ncbi:protein IQ-DOMAIN 24-like isoform X2 [Prosopis cineraria]|uniref:protein IQ-DOMAIN 24-like isoform X2 n=1 Tax=Prosopis cineraria TaxID=364024 RepID=UPI00240F8860|nr:protein IQ-DOMAIN 24-like isoform X2 [Prosopis cineraria]
MGFLRRLFGGKKPAPPAGGPHKSGSEPGKSKRRWSFAKHSKDKSQSATSDPNSIDLSTSSLPFSDSLNANKHAIAVAAATAAVAEAALAAAHAAAEVVRLTNGGGGCGPSTNQHQWPEEIAAIKIQSAFRGYLVSEHYESSLRASSTKFDGSPLLKRCSSNANFRDIGSGRSRFGSQWFDPWVEENVWNHPGGDDEKSDKILEVDTWKPHLNSQNENRLPYESPSKRSSTRTVNQSIFSSLKFQKRKEEKASRAAENGNEFSAHSYQNSPESFSTSRRRSGPFTPTRSECGYFGHPNYMANTESSRAKARSVSAPRQRLWDSWNNSDRHADFRSQCFTSSTSSRFSRIWSTHLR